jgi:hypothetical protein
MLNFVTRFGRVWVFLHPVRIMRVMFEKLNFSRFDVDIGSIRDVI